MSPENPPAFPRPLSNGIVVDRHGTEANVELLPQSGMSLRDYFAGMAMCGNQAGYCITEEWPTDSTAERPRLLAAAAYRVADAMLAERSKK